MMRLVMSKLTLLLLPLNCIKVLGVIVQSLRNVNCPLNVDFVKLLLLVVFNKQLFFYTVFIVFTLCIVFSLHVLWSFTGGAFGLVQPWAPTYLIIKHQKKFKSKLGSQQLKCFILYIYLYLHHSSMYINNFTKKNMLLALFFVISACIVHFFCDLKTLNPYNFDILLP